MPTSESQFKAEFRSDLSAHGFVWTNNDAFRHGLPDFCGIIDRLFVACEAKFVKELPKRKTSLLLKHEVTGAQAEFLQNIHDQGQHAFVAVGFLDTSLIIPWKHWGKLGSGGNITLEDAMHMRHYYECPKVKGHWNIEKFLSQWRNERD